MKKALALVLLAAAVAAPSATPVVAPFRAVLRAPKTQPKVNVKWWYSIRVTDLKGNPLKARLTAKIIDPIGGVHAIAYGPSRPERPITNWPFTGTFRDYITFPPASRNVPLTLRWTVKTKIGGTTYRKVLKRKVTPG